MKYKLIASAIVIIILIVVAWATYSGNDESEQNMSEPNMSEIQ